MRIPLLLLLVLLLMGAVVPCPPPPTDTTAPAAPTVIVTGVTGTSATLSWAAVTDRSGIARFVTTCNSLVWAPSTVALTITNTQLAPSTAHSCTVVAVDGAGNTSSPGTASFTTTASSSHPIATMARGTWYEVPSSDMRQVAADATTYAALQGNTGVRSVMDTWAGGAYDNKRDRLVVMGGGHLDYWGNELYAFDVPSLTWSRLTDPNTSITVDGSGYTVSTDAAQPTAVHTYDGLEYLPIEDQFCNTSSSLDTTGNTFCYQLPSGPWVRRADPALAPDLGVTPNGGYDPVTGRMLMHPMGPWYHYVQSYNPTSNAWTRLSDFFGQFGVDRTAEVDPVHRTWFAVGSGSDGNGTTRVDLTGGTTGNPSSANNVTTTGNKAMEAAKAPGLAWDPVANALVAWSGGANIYTLNPVTLVWTLVPPAASNTVIPQCVGVNSCLGGASGAVPNANGTYGRFRYMPRYDAFIVVNSVDSNVYFYKPVRPNIGGTVMPSLVDEKATYTRWGWTWNVNQEPSWPNAYPASSPPIPTYTIPPQIDVHGDTEGDDLWTYLMQYLRTNQPGYLVRATEWARYFKDDYRQCPGYCGDAGMEFDHMYGWGLLAWYEYLTSIGNGTAATFLAAAEAIGGDIEAHFAQPQFVPGRAMSTYSIRAGGARMYHIAARLAEVTGTQRWVTLRDKITSLWLASPDWDTDYSMYFFGVDSTDVTFGTGSYAAGVRAQHTMSINMLTDAFVVAERGTASSTTRAEIRTRVVAMARFIQTYGLDATYHMTGSIFGVHGGNGNEILHNYHYPSTITPTFWDHNYTTSLVNTLVRGYQYSGDTTLLDSAKVFFRCGTTGGYGVVAICNTANTAVDHFVDTITDSSTDHRYLAHNKGELQVTYALFQNGGFPPLLP